MKCSGGGGKAVCGALSTAGVIAAVVRHVLVVLGARLLLVEPFVASAPLAKRMAARHCCVRLQRHAPAQNAQKPWQARAQQLEPELLIVLTLLHHFFFFLFFLGASLLSIFGNHARLSYSNECRCRDCFQSGAAWRHSRLHRSKQQTKQTKVKE